jgi:hypothetical protein
MCAANLQFCAFLLFGANNLQIRKNDYASRLAEMEKAHSVDLVQNLVQASCDGSHHKFM